MPVPIIIAAVISVAVLRPSVRASDVLVGDAKGSGGTRRRGHVCADIYSVFRNLWESKLAELQFSCSFVDTDGAYPSKFRCRFQVRVRNRGHDLSRLVFPEETASKSW